MNGIDLVLLVLGAYRVWMLVAKDVITQRWRVRLLGYTDTGQATRWKLHKRTAEFVHCPWCLGFWISVVASGAYWLWPHATRYVLLPFAVSAALALVSVTFDRLVLEKK